MTKLINQFMLFGLVFLLLTISANALSTSNLGNLNVTGNTTIHGGLLVQTTTRTAGMANLTLLSVTNGTTYSLNSTNVVTSSVLVYGANSTVALTLLSVGNYTLNAVNGTLLLPVTNSYWNGGNLTVDYDRYSFINLTPGNAFVDGNITANNFNGNIVGSSGYIVNAIITWLGTIADRVSKIFVTEIDAINVTAKNITVTDTLLVKGKVINDTWAFNQTVGLNFTNTGMDYSWLYNQTVGLAYITNSSNALLNTLSTDLVKPQTNVTENNLTSVNCVNFRSGGSICSGS